MRVVIACGGTGGHIYPGLAVAAALRERDPRTEILFIGSGGLEARLIPQEGWPFRRVAARQLPRRPTLGALWALGALAIGTVQALVLLGRLRPDVVVATGGYAAAPVGAAATVLRIPLVLQEQNLFAGVTNRVLARWAAAVSLPHDRVRMQFPHRVMVTGVPIRATAMGGRRDHALAHFGLRPGVFTVLVLGGSQGAQSLNDAMLAAVARLRDPGSVQILHQTGKGHEERSRARAREIQAPRYVAVGYIENIADAYASADLVVCRAGAGTLAEVTANGVPFVAVPYPYAAAGHQESNARLMEQEGAAVVVLDRDLTAARLVEVIDALRSDAVRLRAMAEASRRMGRPRAAAQVAELVAQVARKEQR
jgi:UDP-N-acetylglucosamine--N-acetylmuramyl-(pentapeptide) pyrophosphoryl-undecaprenol N-acetylglucosamine transferase